MKYKDSRLLYHCIKKHTPAKPAGVEGERAPPAVAESATQKKGRLKKQTTT
ncbi:hypothetical protein [Neisseria mucosa]|uniref:hypothetical protein n=1 Tax=Neisseria mucosa TaxID=488 RepID=UPI0018787535|nr:hypothetical protein [Neisseria mucosa]